MKPRQREPQKQTSRLFLRTKDHRDVIYQDKYHNAIWANTDDIDDELVWLKYPKNALLNTYYISNGTFGWMDVDRQFQYGRNYGGSVRGQLFSLECGIVVNVAKVSNSYQTFSISEDGIVWQDMRSESMNPHGLEYFHFGEDSLCWIKVSDTIVSDQYWPLDHAGFVVGVVTFSKDEETGRFKCELHQYSYVDVVRTAQFVCNTKQGCIINTTYGDTHGAGDVVGAREYTFWHIDHAGIKNKKYYSMWATNSIWDNLQMTNATNSYGFAYAKVDNDCFCIVSTANKQTYYGTTVVYRIQVLHSGDLGETWDGEALWELTLGYPLTFAMNINIRVCAGEVFALWASAQGDGNKCHMYSTTDGVTWSEVALPTWLDVPVVDGGGSGVKTSPGVDTLRIAIDPLNTSDYQLQLGNILGDPRWDSNARGMAIMFSDGELVKEADDVVRFCFGQTGNNGYMAFFDNKYLAENARAFAWQNTSQSEIADTIQQYDYVLG